MNLIVLHKNDSLSKNRFRIADKRAEHIRKILKASIGTRLNVGMVNGPLGHGHIESISTREVILNCRFKTQNTLKKRETDIICAMPRPQTLKKVLKSCATMGIRNLHLVNANRTEKMYFSSTLVRQRNFHPYLFEGLAQGRQTRLTNVHIHDRFRVFFEDTLPKLELSHDKPLTKLLPDLDVDNNIKSIETLPESDFIIAIGPEGGWVPFETEMMQKLGFKKFKLGPWTLRVENALTAAISQIQLI